MIRNIDPCNTEKTDFSQLTAQRKISATEQGGKVGRIQAELTRLLVLRRSAWEFGEKQWQEFKGQSSGEEKVAQTSLETDRGFPLIILQSTAHEETS